MISTGLTYKSRVNCVTANTRKSTARRKRPRPSSVGSPRSTSTASSNSTAPRSRRNLLPRSIPPNFPPTSPPPPTRGHPLSLSPSGLRPFFYYFVRRLAECSHAKLKGTKDAPQRGPPMDGKPTFRAESSASIATVSPAATRNESSQAARLRRGWDCATANAG